MLDYEFRWIDWNLDKIAKHGLDVEDVEFVVVHARRPYPQYIEDEKILVRGQAESGAYIQVIYLVREDGQIFVIHARPLTEKRSGNCAGGGDEAKESIGPIASWTVRAHDR